MRDVWHKWRDDPTNGAPASYGIAGFKRKEDLRDTVYEAFSFMALCENDWKLEAVATQQYPSFAQNHLRAKGVKTEREGTPALSSILLPTLDLKRKPDSKPTAHHALKKVKREPVPHGAYSASAVMRLETHMQLEQRL